MPFFRRQFAGAAVASALAGSMTTTSTSVLLTTTTGWPDGTIGPFVVTVNRGQTTEEKILVTSRSGNNLNFTIANRGWDQTVATAHNTGESCEITLSATDLDEANQAVVGTIGAATTKGDMLAATGANVLARVAVGTTNQVLVADSTQAAGVRWGAAPASIDTVAGDIAPIGWAAVGAAGATGKAADAGHIHPGWARPMAIEHTWAISGPLAVPAAGTAFIPPMFVSVPAGSTKRLRALRYQIRAGTSATFSFNQNGVGVASLTGLAATTTATTTAAGAGTPVALADGDSLTPVISAVSAAPDGLSITAFFDVIP
jgi:hypothetical protein